MVQSLCQNNFTTCWSEICSIFSNNLQGLLGNAEHFAIPCIALKILRMLLTNTTKTGFQPSYQAAVDLEKMNTPMQSNAYITHFI